MVASPDGLLVPFPEAGGEDRSKCLILTRRELLRPVGGERGLELPVDHLAYCSGVMGSGMYSALLRLSLLFGGGWRAASVRAGLRCWVRFERMPESFAASTRE